VVTEEWHKFRVSQSCSIREVISNLNNTGTKFALVTSDSGQLIGTIVDGDIRRGLISGLSLENNVTLIMNKLFISATPNLTQIELLKILKENNISHIPILNSSGFVIDVFSKDVLFNETKSTSVIIMAGGEGKRLRPLTYSVPKPMLLLEGKPILERIIEKITLQGFQKFIISINYLGEQIENYFGDGSKWGISISYIKEEFPMGTIGSVSLIKQVPSNPMILVNGDVLSDINLVEMLEFHRKKGSTLTIGVKNFEMENPFGVVETLVDQVTAYVEKPRMISKISGGVYILSPSVVGLIKQNQSQDIPEFINELLSKKERVFAFHLFEKWRDIGNFEDFKGASHQIQGENL